MEFKLTGCFHLYIIFTAIICGALVMVIEVMGSRVISPVYGVSLFVWTSLITVTLVALSFGYAAGGIIADRGKSPDNLFIIIFAAGIATGLVPLLKKPVLALCLPLGLRFGSLTSSALLFFPALFLLGCVSPYIIRIAAEEMHAIGRTVGRFYALSTLGSFIGTVMTGFVLIGYFGVNRVFTLSGVTLVALSALYFAFFKRKPMALALIAISFLVPQPGSKLAQTLSNGTTITKLLDSDSFYGNIKVVERRNGKEAVLDLLVDNMTQGGMDIQTGESVYPYSYFASFLSHARNPDGKSCLVAGLGIGAVPMWFEGKGVSTDVIDIDPEIVRTAEKYFGFRTSGRILIDDARHVINGLKDKKYDFIVLDVYSGENKPSHLLSIEAMKEIRSRLSGHGILTINLVGSIREDTFVTASVIRTLESVFREVEVYPVFDVSKGGVWGNIIVLAYDFPAGPMNLASLRSYRVHPKVSGLVSGTLGKRFTFPQKTPYTIITDDLNPIDLKDIGIKEKARENTLRITGISALL